MELGLPYLILDGTLVASDRCAEKQTSKKGHQIDRWYSGKAHHPAGNVQALASPRGAPLWVWVKKPARGELDPDTRTRNALLRSLR